MAFRVRRTVLLQLYYLPVAWLCFLVTLLALARIHYLLEGHELGWLDFLQLFALAIGFALLGCFTITFLRDKVRAECPEVTSSPDALRSASDPAPHLPPRDSRC